MTMENEEFQFAPYQLYRSQITQLEDFAQQAQFSFRISQSFMSDGPGQGESEAPDPMARAREDLYRTGFLLEWSFLTVFVEGTVRELLRRYPAKIGGDRFAVMSFEEIFSGSQQFTSVDTLQDLLITQKIERITGNGQGINGLLQFLKRDFRFRADPYEPYYTYKGQSRTATAKDFAEIHTIHQHLMYNAGPIDQAFLDRHPQLIARNGQIVITDELHSRSKAIMNGMAMQIVQSIENGWYTVE